MNKLKFYEYSVLNETKMRPNVVEVSRKHITQYFCAIVCLLLLANAILYLNTARLTESHINVFHQQTNSFFGFAEYSPEADENNIHIRTSDQGVGGNKAELHKLTGMGNWKKSKSNEKVMLQTDKTVSNNNRIQYIQKKGSNKALGPVSHIESTAGPAGVKKKPEKIQTDMPLPNGDGGSNTLTEPITAIYKERKNQDEISNELINVSKNITRPRAWTESVTVDNGENKTELLDKKIPKDEGNIVRSTALTGSVTLNKDKSQLQDKTLNKLIDVAKNPLAKSHYVETKFISKMNGWTIFYNETKLHETIKTIHDTLYEHKRNDRCLPRYPGVIIVGVSKSGTRELSDFLALHPNMVVKSEGGRYKISEGAFFKRNPQVISKQMPCTYGDQFGSMKQDFFFSNKKIPQLLHELSSHQKIIAIVREPISRIISQKSFREIKYGNNVNDMSITSHLFKQGKLNTNSSIVRVSSYADNIDKYLKYFTMKQILILETDSFNKDPASTLGKVQTFLNLKQRIQFQDYFVINPETGFTCVRIPDANKQMVCYNSNRGRGKIDTNLSEDYMNQMKAYFKPMNERFFKLIGQRFDNWMTIY